jgi:hypothetical protein
MDHNRFPSSNDGLNPSYGSIITSEDVTQNAQSDYTPAAAPQSAGFASSQQSRSYESLPSDLSSVSAGTNDDGHSSSFASYPNDVETEDQSENDEDEKYSGTRKRRMSPDTSYRIPPAPPSTPASHKSNVSLKFEGLLDYVDGPPTAASSISATSFSPFFDARIVNDEIIQHQYMYDTRQSTPALTTSVHHLAATSAPTPQPKSAQDGRGTDATMATPKATRSLLTPLPEDFSTWSVGDRYELVRILGRGSYGEVAQAIDRRKTNAKNGDVSYVAIKRIQSPFEQQLEAVRLYREIHILRRMKEGGEGTINSKTPSHTSRHHECIIQLLDVVQPAALNDFHELYLVFECMFWQKPVPFVLRCFVSILVSNQIANFFYV